LPLVFGLLISACVQTGPKTGKAGSYETMLSVVDHMVGKIRKEDGG